MRNTRRWQSSVRLFAAVVGLATLDASLAAPAYAQRGAKPTVKTDASADKRAAARAAYTAAEAAFGSGDFGAAYEKYKEANDIIPAPQTLWKMALCLDKGGKETEAADAYTAFLASSPPESMAERVSEAKARVAALKSVSQVRLKIASDPAGATITVDGKAADKPTPGDVLVPPGKHHVRLDLAGYETAEKDVDVALGVPAELRITLRKGSATAVAVVPTPATASAPVAAAPTATPPPPPPAPAAASASTKKGGTLPWVLVGAAAAGAAVGSAFGVMALSAKSDFKGDPTSDKADKAERNALIADVSFGVALTLGVTGVVLMTTRSGAESAAEETAPRSKSAFTFVPVLGLHTGGAAAQLSF